MGKYTYKELVEIKNDQAKEIIVLDKIVEVHKNDLWDCILRSTGKVFKDYNDFKIDLDRRFNEKKEKTN